MIYSNGKEKKNMKQYDIKLNQPAHIWEEAFPLGNGHLGAMVYGGPEREIIQFNHDTFWSGHVHKGSYVSNVEALKFVRDKVQNGNCY